MYEYRRIADAELPRVRDLVTGTETVVDHQQLQNLGLFRVEGDIFLCVGVFDDGNGAYASDAQLPGRRLARGYMNRRTQLLTGQDRRQVVRTRVLRHVDAARNLRREMGDVASGPSRGDVIEAARSRAIRTEIQPSPDVVVLSVPAADVQPGDVVIEADQIPVVFSGEGRVG